MLKRNGDVRTFQIVKHNTLFSGFILWLGARETSLRNLYEAGGLRLCVERRCSVLKLLFQVRFPRPLMVAGGRKGFPACPAG